MGEKEHQPDRVRQRRLAEIVRTIEHVQSWAEGNLPRPDAGNILDAESMNPHGACSIRAS